MATETKAETVNNQLEADTLVLTGAAIVGIKDGVQEVAENKAELAKKMLEPGDQRHIAHPLDDLVADTKNLVSDISNKVEAAYSAGDMNIHHSRDRQPHPIDNTATAINATYDTLQAKGAVEGTRAGAAMMAAGITEAVITPSGKAKAVGTITDIATDTKAITSAEHAIHGEYIAANEASKAIAHPIQEVIPEAKASLKDKLLNSTPVKMFTEVINPPLDTRIALAAQKAKPSALDHIDETHKPGGDVGALHAQSDDRFRRAEKLAEIVRDNPEFMAKNTSITDAQINALINDTSSDRHLGLEHNSNSVPRLLSPQEQEIVNVHQDKISAAKQAIADEKVYQDSLPLAQRLMRKFVMDNANPETGFFASINRYGGSKNDHMAMAAAETESEQLKLMSKNGLRGALTVVGIVKLATIIALADEKPVDEKSIGRPMSENEKTALKFVNAHLGGETPETKAAAMKQLQTAHPSELNNAVDMYLKLQSHLMKDGNLSEQDAITMKQATANITGKLAAGEPLADKNQQFTHAANLELEHAH